MGRFKLSRHKKIQNIKEKYGHNILDDFYSVDKDYGKSLADIGVKYGFTREFARQLYKIIFGRPYTKSKHDKSLIRKTILENDIDLGSCVLHKFAQYKKDTLAGIGVGVEKMFYDECLKRGLNATNSKTSKIDLVVNGYFVEIKSRFSSLAVSKRQNSIKYYHYNLSKYQFLNSDFVACYHKGTDSFFIVPKISFPNGKTIFIGEHKSNYQNAKNRYWEFQNAWHLLERTKLQGGV